MEHCHDPIHLYIIYKEHFLAKATEDTVKGGGDSLQSKFIPKSAKIY